MAQQVSEITKVWQVIKVAQVTEAVVNVNKENNIISSADMMVSFKIPESYNPEFICHTISSCLALTSNQFAIELGTYENIQIAENQGAITKQYQVVVPLYRKNATERAIFDKFHSQKEELQHFCVKMFSKFETIRIRTVLNVFAQEFTVPSIGTAFVDRSRISHVWLNTKANISTIASAAVQPFAGCTKRRKEEKPESQTQLSTEVITNNSAPQSNPNFLYPTITAPGMPEGQHFSVSEKGEIFLGNINNMVPIPVFVQMNN